MDDSLNKADLEAFMIKFTPALDALLAMYSNSNQRFSFPPDSMEQIRSLGFPEWVQFYEPGGPMSFLNFMLGLIGLDKMDFPKEDPTALVPELADVLTEIDSARLDNGRISENVQQKAVEILLRYIAFINDAVCLLHFKEGISELLPKARAGDMNAFLKILKVDKSVLCTDWASKRIREAQIACDRKFFDRIGRAIAEKLGVGRFHHLKLAMLLWLLWTRGLNKMTTREIFDFLENQGLYGKKFGIYDDQTLSQFLNRIGLKKYTKGTPKST
jgi:hypothetical protein